MINVRKIEDYRRELKTTGKFLSASGLVGRACGATSVALVYVMWWASDSFWCHLSPRRGFAFADSMASTGLSSLAGSRQPVGRGQRKTNSERGARNWEQQSVAGGQQSADGNAQRRARQHPHPRPLSRPMERGDNTRRVAGGGRGKALGRVHKTRLWRDLLWLVRALSDCSGPESSAKLV